jgi:cysteinyl-tRNA synthetase
VLYRLLRHVYGIDHVSYVRNFTDVDDKINATAIARKEAGATGTLVELVHERSSETIEWYLNDMRAVGALDPNEMPRATEYIPQMIAMIEDLIEKGHAYPDGKGHVLFSVNSYEHYGALSGRSTDDMIAGARVEVADNKRDPMDFVLWKPSSDGVPGWNCPWGYGRPGWHIECSAMAQDLLGDRFDIHGGGNDLMFPHHENEIAQSCCASGHAHDDGGFANYWLHNEMLQVEGKKMSKSLGNFFTVRDLLDGHNGAAGVEGEVIRFVFLSTHYRKPMDWTQEKADQAKATLKKWYAQIKDANANAAPSDALIAAIADDLNTAGAIAELHKLSNANNADALRAGLCMLGLMIDCAPAWANEQGADLSAYVMAFNTVRDAAKANKDFAPVDALKSALTAAGVEVRMTREGVELEAGPKFDASKLEGLV